MNTLILNNENQDFINKNLDKDVSELLLQTNSDIKIDIKLLAEQIEAKKRCKKKLPTWYQTPKIYYPNKLNIEQTSSETTAAYKAQLINGNNLIDLTGGFGVDSFYFSKQFESVIHCEINKDLSNIVAYNFKQLEINNVQCIPYDGVAYLKQSSNRYSWIYLDPSRRHDQKGKVFFLKDCLPNVPDILDDLFSYSDHILIKTSPLLDISSGINELKHVNSIHVLAVNNDVKELLWVLKKEKKQPVKITTVNIIDTSPNKFEFFLKDEVNTISNYSLPLKYLYEPNAAVLKAGAFNSIGEKLDLKKIHQHTHLYTSDKLIVFPGRVFYIVEIIPYNKKSLKKLDISKANITTRNFKESVQTIRKKLKIKDGGDQYLFFTTNINLEQIVIICKKIKVN
ncbi:THUMP-like domain-containing protein [Hanstruepera ponticola]|uniref:THUMP-like domain-containing protein n=1 Tax=Hanstruepera ponticola TaxID=2042995 RepID=UPI0017856854|nr:class I SAM-dependent methyltransferase [Hanstruepera ponticola]